MTIKDVVNIIEVKLKEATKDYNNLFIRSYSYKDNILDIQVRLESQIDTYNDLLDAIKKELEDEIKGRIN